MSDSAGAPGGGPCPDRETLLDWMVGRLKSDALLSLTEHVELCDACGDMLDRLDDSSDDLTDSLRRPSAAEPFTEDDEDRIVAVVSEVEAFSSGTHADVPVHTEIPVGLKSIGSWELQDVVGRGSMGLVCRAIDSTTGDTAAIKIIPDVTEGRRLERFQRETVIACGLDHPGIVRAFDGGVQDGKPYLVMEWLDGLDLGTLLRRVDRLGIPDAAEVGRQVAATLEYSADQGVVHRDLKPSNLMLTSDGRIRVLDFGLARVCLDAGNLEDLTSSSQLLGTADYIAPEQTKDPRDVDIRADLYSLGCLLFHCVTGQPPFGNVASPLRKLEAHRSWEFPSLQEHCADAPEEFCGIIARLCMRDRTGRPATPEEAAELLEQWTDGADLSHVFNRARR